MTERIGGFIRYRKETAAEPCPCCGGLLTIEIPPADRPALLAYTRCACGFEMAVKARKDEEYE